jgi:hypothetical protein
MQAIPKAGGMQRSPHSHFWFGVTRAYERHLGAASGVNRDHGVIPVAVRR